MVRGLARSLLGVSAVVVALAVVVGNALGQVQYTVTDLGTLSGGNRSEAYGINDSGQVVGWAQVDGAAYHAFLYSGGTMQDLGTFGGASSQAYGINDSGQIVGWAQTSGGAQHAFLYSGGSMQDLGLGQAFGINDSGQAVGTSFAVGFNGVGGNSVAYGINNNGQIVGGAITPDGAQHAFLFSGGSMQDLGTIGTPYYDYNPSSQAMGINDSGQIAGYSDLNAGSAGILNHAFLYGGGSGLVLQDLGTLGGVSGASEAFGINDSGQVVGFTSISGGADHAFVYSVGSMHDLNNLIPSSSDWILTEATAINNEGQIVGYGDNPSGQRR
jgi:probable HAF family extracellular repeat protein